MQMPKWMVSAKHIFSQNSPSDYSVAETHRRWTDHGWFNDLDKLVPGTLYRIVSPGDHYCWVMPEESVEATRTRKTRPYAEVALVDFSIMMFVEKQIRYSGRHGYGTYYHILQGEKTYWIYKNFLINHYFKEFDSFQE